MAWIFTTDGNYVNFNGGGNLWRLHKDSNCISWHWDETGDLFFDVYDQEYTVKAGNIADVIINGTPRDKQNFPYPNIIIKKYIHRKQEYEQLF